MSAAYYRLKKYRQKQSAEAEVSTSRSDVPNIEQHEIENLNLSSEMPMEVSVGSVSNNSLSLSQHTNTRNHDSNNYSNHLLNIFDSSVEYNISPDTSSLHYESPLSSPSSENSSHMNNSENHGHFDNDITANVPSLREKLRNFAVQFRTNLTVEIIENLLQILRSENHCDLPKSAVGLLQTKSNNNIIIMKSSKNTNGSYVYFGIEEGLKSIITDDYTENSIRLLFNIDGLPLYNSSSYQFWPILGLILHNDYESNPFIVAVFSGDSKPQNVNNYLKDFVQETITLIQNGLVIGQRHFKIEIVGFSCDTPARSYIKKCKGHGGFYACERCETKGKTINKKRVYPSIKSKLRTKKSFTRQHQSEHHLDGRTRLLDIPKFDPVRCVFLDSMHLLYLGIMKWILQQLLGTKSHVNRKCKLSRCQIQELNSTLNVFVKLIPKEFQRKKLDLATFNYWKATQFRFFLNYCGALVLVKVIPKKMYKHFLLLVVACRILNDPELCIEYVSYARELLRKFFELLSSFYGPDSQIMNSHNLIHLADDVEHANMVLSAVSAFPFENFLGKIKRLIRGRSQPLEQLVRRVSEQKSCPEVTKKNGIRKKKLLIVNPDITHKTKGNIKSIILRGVEISSSKPNNIVKLNSGKVFSI
ncbi:Uncharacterized protein FWK35_00038704, partial [Aphis craccivora]